MNGTINCETFGLLEKYGSNYLTYYGIAASQVGQSFALYPQIADGKTWLNSTFYDAIYGNLTYSLYNADMTVDHGFRIKDADCWNNLVNIFNAFEHNETIIVGAMRQADIIGGIIVL